MKSRSKALFWVNVLTLSRIPGVFAFMATALVRVHGGGVAWAWAALLLLVLSSLTDLFDGWLARRYQVTSDFGAHADPLADKMFYLVVLPTFVYLIRFTGPSSHALSMLCLTVLYLLRDQWVSFLRSIGAAAGIGGGANWSGKLRTLLSFAYFCLLYLALAFDLPRPPTSIMIGCEIFLTAVTLYSMAVYTRSYAPALRAALSAAVR